jgi:hypothetical protein
MNATNNVVTPAVLLKGIASSWRGTTIHPASSVLNAIEPSRW